MKKIFYTEELTKRTLYYEPINETYCEYEICTEGFINNELKISHSRKSIATIEEVKNITEFGYISSKVKVDWMYQGEGKIVGVSKEVFNKLLHGELHIDNLYQGFYEGPYDPQNNIYCIFNSESWHLADLNKNAICYPIYFDYIHGKVSDAFYNLSEVLEFMKNDHRFMPAKFHGDPELKIMSIPYYNADKYTGYHAIEFCYLPDTKEEMQDFFETSSVYRREKLLEKVLGQFKIKNKNGKRKN